MYPIFVMNGRPTHITVSIAISNRFTIESVEELYSGIKLACENYNIDLVGGDTTSSINGLILFYYNTRGGRQKQYNL